MIQSLNLCLPFLELPTESSSANLPNARKAVHEVAHGRALHVKETTAENLKEEIRLDTARLQDLEEETRLEDSRLQALEETRLEDARMQNLEETRLEDTRLPDFVEARLEEGVEDRAQEKAIQQELLDISGIPGTYCC